MNIVNRNTSIRAEFFEESLNGCRSDFAGGLLLSLEFCMESLFFLMYLSLHLLLPGLPLLPRKSLLGLQ